MLHFHFWRLSASIVKGLELNVLMCGQVISLVHTILKHKDTNVKTVLVVCPLSTVLNWYSEFDKWLEDVHKGRDIKVYHLTKWVI